MSPLHLDQPLTFVIIGILLSSFPSLRYKNNIDNFVIPHTSPRITQSLVDERRFRKNSKLNSSQLYIRLSFVYVSSDEIPAVIK